MPERKRRRGPIILVTQNQLVRPASGWTPDEIADSAIDITAEETDASVGGTVGVFYGQNGTPDFTFNAGNASLLSSEPTMNGRKVAYIHESVYRYATPMTLGTTSYSEFVVGINNNTSTLNQNIRYAYNGTKSRIVSSFSNRAGYADGNNRYFGTGTIPSGKFARIWEWDGAAPGVKFWGPSGFISNGNNYTPRDAFGGDIVDMFGRTSLLYYTVKNMLFHRYVIAPGKTTPELRQKFFDWCASYLNVTT